MATLGEKAVGSIVKLNVGGVVTNFIVVHQGLPSTNYDPSCNGTWLLMESCYDKREFDSTNHDYENSDIHSYLDSTFIDLFDGGAIKAINQVKIPYRKGSGSGVYVSTGANGLSAKVFLLSQAEVGGGSSLSIPREGEALSYFNGAADSKRVATLNGSASMWWLRTPSKSSTSSVYVVEEGGGITTSKVGGTSIGGKVYSYGVRPAIVLSSTIYVADDGSVCFNTAPTISGSDGSLGIYTSPPTVSYSVEDSEGDGVTATIALNGATKEAKTVTLGTAYSYTPSASDWAALALGSHTITITASDGQESVTRTYTFVKEKPVLGAVTVGGIAKEYKDVYVNVAGAWKEAEKVYVMVNGVWKSV